MFEESLGYKYVEVCGVNYLVLEWSQVDKLALIMEDKLDRAVLERFGLRLRDIRYDTLIVGIKRWGDNAANYISDAFAIKEIRSLGIRSYDKDFKRGRLELYQPLNLTEDLSKYKLVILADGVVDSGSTLIHALAFLKKLNLRTIISSTLLVKSHSKIFPDVYGDLIDGKFWVAFPWEKMEISRKLIHDLRNSGYTDKECIKVIQDKFGYGKGIIERSIL